VTGLGEDDAADTKKGHTSSGATTWVVLSIFLLWVKISLYRSWKLVEEFTSKVQLVPKVC
jgi:hypothetical protein